MFGLKRNYYIVEAELSKKDLLQRFKSFDIGKPDAGSLYFNSKLVPNPPSDAFAELNKKFEFPPIPQMKCELPEDDFCFELNRCVYFVTNDLCNAQWTELPLVTRLQIKESRKIVKYLSGDLEANVSRTPYFSGCEKNYLRALIARITASTQIAPDGAYTTTKMHLTEPVEDDESQAGASIVIENPCLRSDYTPKSTSDLMDIKSWVHLQPMIYDDGGIKPPVDEALLAAQAQAELEEKLAQEAAAANAKDAKGGKGKPDPKANDKAAAGKGKATAEPDVVEQKEETSFKSCAEDQFQEKYTAWTLGNVPGFNALKNIVLVKSNIWQGAYAFASDAVSDLMYIGWGIRNRLGECLNFDLPSFQRECDSYPEEVCDPTPEDEEVCAF